MSPAGRSGGQDPAGTAKAPTGIIGLDDITYGGLPRGRATLVAGGPGCGKTILGMEFLAHGALDHGENGVFVSCEETAEELATNTSFPGLDVSGLVHGGKLAIDFIDVSAGRLETSGPFGLEALFIRVGHAIDKVGAKRIVLDTLDSLLDGLPDEATVRSELHRLFRWLKGKGVTAIVTAEQGNGAMTGHRLEEYVSDCVILVEQNIAHQVSTRRLRIVKYRGSGHGTNQYPFIIDEKGISVAPITGASLNKPACDERVSLGVEGLDARLEGKGPYRGSTILVSGTAGTGKTTLAAHFVDAACQRGERCIFYSLEQSADVIVRDAGTLGKRLKEHVDEGLLRFAGRRPASFGLDMHLAAMRRHIHEFRPHIIVMDPVTGFGPVAQNWETKNMLTLLLDTVAASEATMMMTTLSEAGAPPEASGVGISSLVDTWVILRDIEEGRRRERGAYVVKSRGMATADEMRSLVLSGEGMQVLEAEEPAGGEASA